ncbi:MAG: SET domain-containing protein-lysine N-methyltransferase [Flavobacterium sp.]
MKTISYNKIDALESDYLYVETSQIPNSGNGLFTAIDIYKDEMIAVFTGDILNESQATESAEKGNDRYFIIIPDGSTLDSMNSDCFAKYANDSNVNSETALKNNAKIAFDDDGQVGLIALRKIKSGEEIFCSYGKLYWNKWLKFI